MQLLRGVLLGAGVVCAAAVALAEEPVSLPAAQALLAQAEPDSSARDYRAALQGSQQAYDLTGAPALLFDMAQCYRLLGRSEEALSAYKKFLAEVPDSPYRQEIEERIRALSVPERE